MHKVMVRVRNKKGESKSFRRAGVVFSPDWREYNLTADQLDRVNAEPMLEIGSPNLLYPIDEALDLIAAAVTVAEVEEITEGDGRAPVVKACAEKIAALKKGK